MISPISVHCRINFLTKVLNRIRTANFLWTGRVGIVDTIFNGCRLRNVEADKLEGVVGHVVDYHHVFNNGLPQRKPETIGA